MLVADSELFWRYSFISNKSRLAAEGSRAVNSGYCSKSGVQQGNVTQRKALGASTAVFYVSLVDKAMAGLAMGALRLKSLFEKTPACL